MTSRFIKHLQQVWRGPAITIVIGPDKHLVGQGESKTTVLVKNQSILPRFLSSPSLAFGEGYMAGDIEVQGSLLDLLEGFHQTASALAPAKPSWFAKLRRLTPEHISAAAATRNAEYHYNLSPEFYKLWLDPSLTYSCAYFISDTDTLAQAQQQKLDLVCRKVRLREGQTLLDIGCGWGSLLFHAAEKYDATVTGITPSSQQADYIKAEIAKRNLGGKVNVITGDWRELQGTYDRIVSVGMFEHVGQAQYPEFLALWQHLLAPDGISLLHTIGRMRPAQLDPWIRKYIFPGGFLPTLTEIIDHISRQDMVIADVENLWRHYDKTLHAWSENFLAAHQQVVFQFDQKFANMWWLYLQGSLAGFRSGGLQLWQVVILKQKTAAWPLYREVGAIPSGATGRLG